MDAIVLCVIGEYQPDLIHEITQLVKNSECDILECQIEKFGEELVGNLLLSGYWHALAKLEHAITPFTNKHNVQILLQRTQIKPFPPEVHPYSVYVIGKNQPNIIPDVAHFFKDQQIPIEEIYSDIYPTRQTGHDILSVTLTVYISPKVGISELKEQFMLFCDRLHLDGVMEMEKK